MTNGLIHMCVSLSFHLHMDLSTCVWFIPPTHGYICNTTCVWFDHSTYKWTYPQYHMCVILSFHLQMDLSTKPHVCDFIISPTNGLIHKTTCVWFYHFTYKWTYPQNHMCVIWSFHLQMDLSTIPHVCDFIISPTNGLIHNTTCVWFDHSIYKWTYPQNHMCVILSFHLQMDISTIPRVCDFIISLTNGLIHICVIHSIYKWTYPQYHICDFIIPPTHWHIHMCVILSFHLQMGISTCVFIIPPTNGHIHMCVIHFSYKCTYPHVCEFIIPPTNGLIDCSKCLAVNFFFFINPNENVDSL